MPKISRFFWADFLEKIKTPAPKDFGIANCKASTTGSCLDGGKKGLKKRLTSSRCFVGITGHFREF
jgi:hypothetical protein